MSEIATPVEALFEKAENYSKTSLELFKLMVIDKSADLVSSLVVQFAIFMVAAVFTLVINIGIAMWLGDLLGKMYYGFFAVAIFYAVVMALLFIFRHEWIKTPVSNSIISQMTKAK
jgi:hypothetical protein